RSGIVKVWNFHLGICLKEFQAKFSVLALAVLGYEIFAAGTSGLISIFYDDGESTIEDTEWKPLHEQAIVSIDTYRRNMFIVFTLNLIALKIVEIKFSSIDINIPAMINSL
ncbi:hypothetical protein AVEN_161406-1, partial [Araneus ventricosus]